MLEVYHSINPLSTLSDKLLEEFNQKLFKQAQALAVLEDIGSVHAVDVITQDILHIEEMINRYNTRKQEIEVELASELVSKDFIMDFAGFIATVRKGMQLADNDFNLRRKIVEILDVTVILTVENGEPVFYPKCVLKVADRPLLYNDLRTGLQQWQYEPGRKCTRNLILQTRILYKPL